MAYDGTLKFDTSMDSSGFQKDAGRLGDIVKGLAVFDILKKGFEMVVGSIDAAVARYDTLKQFPKIMEQMGYGFENGERSIQKLRAGIEGLPTTSDAITASTRQLTIALNDLDKGTGSALALNNAFLASGSSTDEAARGMDQYLTMLSTGKVDMMRWRTLNETMTYALQKTAESFGFVGASAKNDLYAALQSGDITMRQLNDRIIELNDGLGGFADVAKTATAGIGTSWQNMQTAFVRGTANIIQAIDEGLGETRFKSISNVIDTSGKKISKVFEGIAKAAGALAKNADTLVPIIAAVAAGMTVLKVQAGLAPIFTAATAAMKAMTVAGAAETVVQTAQFQATNILAASKKAMLATNIASVVATKGLTVAETAQAAISGVLAGKISLVTAATWVWNAALIANPLGIIIVLIIAAVAAIALITNAMNKARKTYNDEKDTLKELAKEHENYAETLSKSRDSAAEDAQAKLVQAQHNRDLLDSMAGLVDANGKYAGSADDAKLAVSELNSNIDGLGLAFDETTGRINMSSVELKKYGENLEAVTSYQSAQSEYNNLLKEQQSLQAKINALEEKKKLYWQEYENGNLTQKETLELMGKAEKLSKEYGDSMKDLALDVKSYEAAAKNAYNSEAEIAIRRQNIINNQIRDVNKLAYQYGMTADDVLDAASKMEGGLDEWAQKMELTHTKEGLNLDDLAAKWGMTAEAISNEQELMGLTMQEWSDKQDKAWEEYQKAVDGHTQGVINSFKEIPDKYEMSADQMIKILANNREKYAEWRQAMVEISGQVSSETLAELEKLGPGALSAINDMRAGGGEKLMEFDALIRGTMEDSAAYAVQAFDNPQFINAPADAIDASAQMIQGNTAIADAVTSNMEDAMTAAQAVDFSGLGQNIGADIASSIAGGQGAIVSAIGTISNTVQTSVKAMADNVKNTATRMMTDINSAIVTKTATVKSSAMAAASGVVSGLQYMITGGAAAANSMMDGMLTAMNNKAGQLYNKANEIANNIANTLRKALEVHSPSRVMIRLFEFVMEGIFLGMVGMEDLLYRKAGDIADGIVDRLSISPDILSGAFDTLNSITSAPLLRGGALPQAAFAGAGGGSSYSTNLIQNITTPKPLSPAEMTREGQDLLRRSRWQLP